MKRIIVLTLIIQFIAASALGQAALNRYEVEILMNPNAGRKDTREVNSVLMFEKDGIRIQSRRSVEIFKPVSVLGYKVGGAFLFEEVSVSESNGDRSGCVERDVDLYDGERKRKALADGRDG